jgi:hypothetical protein
MGRRIIAAACITASLLLAASAAPSLAQSQLPRPNQLPPAGGGGAPQKPPQAAPQQQGKPQAQQQPQAAPPKPYKAVSIVPPQPMNDPSFEAFRKQVGAAAEKKDKKALGDLVSKSFFWMGEKGDKADKKKAGVDNLAKAINLDAKDGSGWDSLSGFASEQTASPYPEKKDTICAPADPQFDPQALEALAKATGTDEGEWGFPTQPNLEMHAAAQPNSPVVEKLGMHFIRVMDDGADQQGDNPMIKIVAPSGKVGYVPADSISPLGNDVMCYAKEGGAWKIAGFIGGEQ